MTNLTEQWKKGELPYGEYYVENNKGDVGKLGWSEFAGWYNIKQVLAPVPSFEEYIAMKRLISSKIDTRNNQDRLLAENTKLKELLKECIIYVDRYVAFSVVQGNEERKVKSKELSTKIKQVLGEE